MTTKIHVACDSQGKPVEVLLGPGQEGDLKRAEELVGERTPNTVIADKAYDSNKFVGFLEEREVEVVIPPLRCRTAQRAYSQEKYKTRNLIERFFNRLKHYRRVATRYEKTARNFLAFTHLAATLVTLGVNVNVT